MRPDLERLGRYDERRVRERFRGEFNPTYTQVIEVDGAFAGCVALRPAEESGGGVDWLEHFYLAPALQGRGIGTEILTALLADSPRPTRLNVLQGSPARRLYERHGFTLESEDPVDVYLRRPAS